VSQLTQLVVVGFPSFAVISLFWEKSFLCQIAYCVCWSQPKHHHHFVAFAGRGMGCFFGCSGCDIPVSLRIGCWGSLVVCLISLVTGHGILGNGPPGCFFCVGGSTVGGGWLLQHCAGCTRGACNHLF